ncbi:MAG TPA: hypothetical protein VNK45_07155 [Candidatus Acidoferrales bacterium]|nr:hypothetical protein [Candidatus Acidoferrales bacterium]
MNKLIAGLMLVLLSSAPGWASSQQTSAPVAEEKGASLPDRDQIYGFDLMTKDERKQYRERYEAIESDDERRAFLAQHRTRMQERARALGFGTPEQGEEMAREGALVKSGPDGSKQKKTGHGIHDYLHY